MELNKIRYSVFVEQDQKITKRYNYLLELIEEIESIEIMNDQIVKINSEIDKLNDVSDMKLSWDRQLRKSTNAILKILEYDLKIVAQKHYQTLWFSLGLASFGVPLGVLIGILTDNMGLLGIGLPMGLVIGMFYGMQLDNKAQKEGRQLKIKVYE